MSYEENVRAILQCCFSQSKDEVIESAVKAIVALKPNSVFIPPQLPLGPAEPWRPVEPWYHTINTTETTPPEYKTDITC